MANHRKRWASSTENDFSKEELAKRSAVRRAWQASGMSSGLPSASFWPNISTSFPGTLRTLKAAQDSPVMVRSHSLEAPSALFRDIVYPLPSQRPAQANLPELQQPQQVTSGQQPQDTMSSFSAYQASNGMMPDLTPAEVIDPAMSDTFEGFSPSPAAGYSENLSSPAQLNAPFRSSPALTLSQIMAANDAALIAANNAATGTANEADQTESSPLPFDQAAAQGMMPPPPPPGQNGQIPPAQDGLPQEAMAEATYNILLGMYTPHATWHRVEGLDTQFFSRESVENRIRYLFDFMADAAGGHAFKERISSNVRIQRASLVNANRHVEVGEQQLNILNGLAVDEPIDHPHGGAFRVEGRAAITEKLNTDKFWQDVMGLELRMSELALERVEVARKATILLYDARQDLQPTAEAVQELEELYAKFQDMRGEAAQLLVTIMQCVGEGRACSDMVQRHRNELWDLWGGRPGVDSVL